MKEEMKMGDASAARLALAMSERAHHLTEDEREKIRSRAHKMLKDEQEKRGIISEYGPDSSKSVGRSSSSDDD